MKFHEHILLYDYLKRNPDVSSQGLESFYREQIAALDLEFATTQNRHLITAHNQATTELGWHKEGRPYFKIFPNLLPMFMTTKLSVPGKYFHSPFSNFLIRFPENHGCEELTVDGHELRTALVTEVSKEETIELREPVEHSHMFIVWMNFGEHYEGVPYYIYQVAKFRGEETIEEAIARQRTPDKVDKVTLACGMNIGDDKINSCMRVVVSTCFLATGADRIVEPDVLSKDLQKYIEAQRSGDSDRIRRMHGRAQKRGKKGWTLGREIVIPAHSQSGDDGGSTGDQLKYQHQRGAHFHVYHHGPGKKEWTVKWINQLTVRADLPLPPVKTQRGYVAK